MRRLLPAALIAIGFHAFFLFLDIPRRHRPVRIVDNTPLQIILTWEIVGPEKAAVSKPDSDQAERDRPEPVKAPIPRPSKTKVKKAPVTKKNIPNEQRVPVPDPVSVKESIPAQTVTDLQHTAPKAPQDFSPSRTLPGIPDTAVGRPFQAKRPEPHTADATPRYKQNQPPRYPQAARKRKIEGTVIILATVSKEGRVTDARVETSSGHALLDNAALGAVRGWEFEPGRHEDEPVASVVKLPITFRLE